MASNKGGTLLQQRSLARIHKANEHLQNVRTERLLQNRVAVATKLKSAIEKMENKFEVLNYLIR